MRLSRQAALAIALVCGLLAAILTWFYVGKQARKAPPSPQKVMIPVPAKTIPPQVDLQPDMFKQLYLDKDKVPIGIVTTMEGFDRTVSLTELTEGQPVKANQIAVKSKSLGLAYAIPPGLRAMAISLDAIGTVGDFIQPGCHVDIVASFQKEGESVVKTVIQDVLVLAVGGATSVEAPKEEKKGEAAGPEAEKRPTRRQESPITLAVTPYQAQLLLASDVAGKLRLVLRATGDRAVSPMPASNSWSLIGPVPVKGGGGNGAPGPPAQGATAAAAATQPTPAPPGAPVGPQGPQAWGAAPTQPPAGPKKPQRPSVEVIRGGQKEIVTP